MKAPVEGRVDGTQLAAGEEAVQVLHTIPRQDGDPVPFGNPGLVFEPICQAVDSPVPLAIGQAQVRIFASIDDRQLIR